MAAGPGFVHLHVHSSFSLLEGALTIGKLAKLAAEDRMPALALTDTNNLFGALEFSEKLSGTGIQPITGIELCVDFGDRPARMRPGIGSEARGALVLLAASPEGYARLMALSSRAFLDNPAGDSVHLPIAALEGQTEGLIALTGGGIGPIDRAFALGGVDLARTRLRMLRRLFPNRLYIELERFGLAEARAIEPALIDLAIDERLPAVAANNAYFAAAEDFEAHDALLCIAGGVAVDAPNRRRLTPEHRFKTRAEMAALFADLPEALEASVEIAERCHVRPRTRRPILPRFTAGDVADEAAELRRQAEAGLAARLAAHGPAPGRTATEYHERLAFELSVIERMQYPGYFLIVADFIQWAKAQAIPVGPGRGSGAGSLVAYSLTITDLDPLRYGLFFERFLNPERVSMPDFDIDFCQDRRDEVIRYVVGRYGAGRVAQIITFGTLLARGVLRDVGRVLGLPYGQVDRLTKLVPQNPANPITLAKAIEEEPQLRAAAAENEAVGRMLAIAQKLEGLYRHASTHAAGIVIGDRPLEELVPLYRDPKSDMPVTQFNMKWVEPAGLVKFDFLGLKTLTVLQGAVDLLARQGITVDLLAIPLDDPASYAMLARGETVGVFQVESAGMRRALVEMKPDRIEDIIALVALYRPGPMANIPVYCDVKHGRQKADYAHPMLEPILAETFGVIVYQEQVMQIAKVMAGYSLGEADMLRRAMGKKIKAEMDAQRARFVEGAVANGVGAGEADQIFDLLARFADYGFNKSHAAAYALVAYQTAYLKANYPVEFLAASMSLELSNTDKLGEFRREAQRLGIRVEPPDVNRSQVAFDVRDGAILYALAAVKGVGIEAARAIVAAREQGPFRSVADFARRIDPRLVNKRTLEQLVGAGALDALEPNRGRLVAGLDAILAEANAHGAERASGQGGLFGGGEESALLVLPEAQPLGLAERLRREHAAVGFFLSGHPLDPYAALLDRASIGDFATFQRAARDGATHARLAATLVGMEIRRTRNGNKIAILALSDRSGQFEAMLFSEMLQTKRALLEPGAALHLTVAGSVEGEDLRVRVLELEGLEAALARARRGIQLVVTEQALRDPRRPAALGGLEQVLKRGVDGEVAMTIMLADGREVDIKLPGRFALPAAAAATLAAIPGILEVKPF
ncbi:DNA polymerase III subunit alpha [Rhabdaerophilum calidifontis]|uniref:DNA polymerase III subunit alpha n=1 Tax=Rhabdaerophilum calidifontis TaxID=2604328 RepID=UPI0012399282|nr:DNA polymerase III subunit alpha [Rhabdaerophilum calidifontis]